MMACGGGGGRSASASSLPYVGSGSVGVSSHSSTEVITSCGVGVIVFPVLGGDMVFFEIDNLSVTTVGTR